ncbi:MAG: threonine/serine exporter family protein, partial [Oscillospiraceae bacterium]|nr:threonine/serine exporter family protein [Oscillospiraceae bacterium]
PLAPGGAVSVDLERMARARTCPPPGDLSGSLIPLVPGAGIYYTMEYALQGETQRFLEQGMLTLGAAVCLAAGVLVVSSAVRIFYMVGRRGKKSARP